MSRCRKSEENLCLWARMIFDQPFQIKKKIVQNKNQ